MNELKYAREVMKLGLTPISAAWVWSKTRGWVPCICYRYDLQEQVRAKSRKVKKGATT